MYIPGFNRIDDRPTINRFIHAHGFATIISGKGDALWASHLPVLLDENASDNGTLRSHMARANKQWRQFADGEEVLCIFPGPHAYISPSWYVMQHTVPTWNYAAVHVYGVPTLIDDPALLRQIVVDTTGKYEASMPNPWTIPLSEDEFDAMLKAVVGFSIRVTRIEAKFKLGQNRSPEDQEKMLYALQTSDNPANRELAEFIQHHRGQTTSQNSKGSS